MDDFERDIRFDVTVIEGLTERKQNTSSLLTLYKYKYKMDLIKTSDSFKPGLKYTAYVSVNHSLYYIIIILKCIIFTAVEISLSG